MFVWTLKRNIYYDLLRNR